MIESLVRGALAQRLIVAVFAAVLFAFGLDAARKLSLDAFPDVTNVQVQIATEAPGRSPEEVERFATVPIEIGMTGLPGLVEMRSLNRDDLPRASELFMTGTSLQVCPIVTVEGQAVNDGKPGPVTRKLQAAYDEKLRAFLGEESR